MNSDVKKFTGLDAPSELKVINGSIVRKNGNNNPLHMPEFEGADICIIRRDDYVELLKRSEYNYDLAQLNMHCSNLMWELVVNFAEQSNTAHQKISKLRKEFGEKYPEKSIKPDSEKSE